MAKEIESYLWLLRAFLRTEIALDEFQERYMMAFKEHGQLSTQARAIVEELSNDLDAVGKIAGATIGPKHSVRTSGRAVGPNLREQAKVALGRLEALCRQFGT